MTDYRFGIEASGKRWLLSFTAAFLAHFLLVSLLLIWPYLHKTPKVNLDMPMLALTQVTIGRKAPAPKVPEEVTPPVPPTEPVLPAEPEPEATPVPPIPEEKPEPPEPVKPLPEPEPKPVPKPEPKPDPKPEPKPKPKPEPKPAPKPAARPAPAKPSSDEVLRRALAQSAMEAALRDAASESEQGGGDGIGILGTYRDSVISRIKPYFTTRPRADGRVFVLGVVLEISDRGVVTNARVTDPSGDPAFDAEVLRAIREAGQMEPPPSKDLQRLSIDFTSDMLSGR